jgi:hypothetical protein
VLVGAAVGVLVGAAVGVLVGAAVGVLVGVLVGAAVGGAVVAVGVLVGVLVGTNELLGVGLGVNPDEIAGIMKKSLKLLTNAHIFFVAKLGAFGPLSIVTSLVTPSDTLKILHESKTTCEISLGKVKDKTISPEKDAADVILKEAIESPTLKFAGVEILGFELLFISSTVVNPLDDTLAKFKSTPTFPADDGATDTETLAPDGVSVLYV